MKNLEYNLHKIAANNKLLIEVLESKITLDKVQHNNFTMLLELIKFKKLDVHIRTLGAISKMGNTTISLKSGVFSKKISQSTVNSIFQVTKNLIN